MVAFRGTSGLQDAIIDMRNSLVAWTSEGSAGCTGCRVHQGFQQQWNAVQTAVLGKLRTLVAANPDYSKPIVPELRLMLPLNSHQQS